MAFLKIKLRTLLLTVFLGTIIISSGLIISVTYFKASKSIHSYALGTIERAGNGIYQKINFIVKETEELPTMGMLFFQHYPEIDIKNTDLILFLLGILKLAPDLYDYYISLPNGSYFIAFNLPTYKTYPDAFTPVPNNAVYMIWLCDRSIPEAPQTQAFFDANFDLIETRERPSNYDPRERPWYIETEQAKTLYWTDPIPHYFQKTGLEISVAQPFYDKTGHLTSIIGADLSMNIFSDFLQEQFVSKHGAAYILDRSGNIFLPENPKTEIEQDIVSTAFNHLQETKAHIFSYDVKKETYLASFHPFPTLYNKHWVILFSSPFSDFFANFLATQRIAVLLSLVVLAIASLLIILVSIHISHPIMRLGHEIDRIARLDLEGNKRVFSHITEIRSIDASIAAMRTALRSFAHYVPKELVKLLMSKEHEIALGGEKKTISIFFSDIANFTSIAEILPIEKLNMLLSEYFEVLTNVILSAGGTIDKYIGDSIMSLWGAPNDLPDAAARACRAALLCQSKLSILHERRRREGMPLFETRMGIKTGSVFVGNFGTSERMNYSVIGDAVNTASRLQLLNKTYHTKIIIGEETMVAAGPQFLVRPLEIVEVRGKKKKLKIFELVAQIDGEPEIQPKPEQIALCALFTDAYNTFEKGDLTQARTLFQEIHAKFPTDYPTIFYLERLK